MHTAQLSRRLFSVHRWLENNKSNIQECLCCKHAKMTDVDSTRTTTKCIAPRWSVSPAEFIVTLCVALHVVGLV